MARRIAAVVGICALASAVCAVGGGLRTGAGAATQRGLSVGDVSVYEGDVGPAALKVPVDLSGPAATKVKVAWSLQPVNATPGVDYTAAHGTLTFAANSAVAKTLTVTIQGDRDFEPDDSFKVVLGTPVGAYLERGTGTVTIRNDDVEPALQSRSSVAPHTGALEVTIGDATVVEADSGVHTLYLPVMLSEPASTKVRVDVSTVCGTASLGVDYLASAKSITFTSGQRSKDLVFRILANSTPEQVESFVDKITLHLGNAEVTVPDGSVTIIDNDSDPNPDSVIERVSVATDGSEATSNGNTNACAPGSVGSRFLAVSADGNEVLFYSDAVNLVPGADDGKLHLYVRDRAAGTTEEVDLADDGSIAGLSNGGAWMSENGRYVLFPSRSGSTYQLLLRDRVAGTTQVASLMSSGAPSSGSYLGSISGDGNIVAFVVEGTPLAEEGVYIRNLAAGTTTFLANSAYGTLPAVSYDGRYVAFVSAATTLVSGDTNDYPDVFVKDRVSGAVDRVNVTTTGAQEAPNPYWPTLNPAGPAISGDGRYVTFTSFSSTFATHMSDVLVRDRTAHTTTIASTGFSAGAGTPACFATNSSLSDNARYVAFELHCEQSDGNGRATDPHGVYVRDRVNGTLARVDALPDGTVSDANGAFGLGYTGVSADGSTIGFSSPATDLVTGDTNDDFDAFVKTNP